MQRLFVAQPAYINNNEYVYFPILTENNLCFINDIVNNVGGFISHDQAVL